MQPTCFRLASNWLLIKRMVWMEPCHFNITHQHFTSPKASLKPIWSQSVANLIFVWTSRKHHQLTKCVRYKNGRQLVSHRACQWRNHQLWTTGVSNTFRFLLSDCQMKSKESRLRWQLYLVDRSPIFPYYSRVHQINKTKPLAFLQFLFFLYVLHQFGLLAFYRSIWGPWSKAIQFDSPKS